MMSEKKALTAKTRRAMKKYGIDVCRSCYEDHDAGNGCMTIGFDHGLTTNQAQAAVNAWREVEGLKGLGEL